jgi:hypothetical protein
MFRRLLFLASIALNVALFRAWRERANQLTVREATDDHGIGIYSVREGGRRLYDPPNGKAARPRLVA